MASYTQSASPTQSPSPSPTGSIKPTNKKLSEEDIKKSNKILNYASSGVNITQVIIATIENGIITQKITDSLYMGGAVALSNFLPAINNDPSAEKLVYEPILAGVLYAAGNYLMNKKGNILKNFGKGLIIGSSSSALANSGLASYYDDSENRIISRSTAAPARLRSYGYTTKMEYPNVMLS